jgi:hypothetical protein
MKQTKFPYIRHRPTVLDELPLDVIRVHIFPCLDYESRINLNQCLPPWDRLPKRINTEMMRVHDLRVRIKHLESMNGRMDDLYTWPYTEDKETKRIKLITDYFLLHLKPQYFEIVKKELYRQVTLTKIDDFTYDLTKYGGNVCINVRLRLIKAMAKVRKMIQKSGPYPPTVSTNMVPELSFV